MWIPNCLSGERAASMHFTKVPGARDSPCVLISHSLEGKSQEPPVAGGCETKRLSDPVKRISTLGIFARGSASM